MTPFAVLCGLAGLSHREAGDFLGVRLDTVKSWSAGRNRTAPGAVDELRALIARQTKAADEAVAHIARLSKSHGTPDEIEIGFPADDHEARALGWPCVGAWAAMAARVLAASDAPIRLVPRGSTAGTAAAADAHGR